MSTRWLDDDEIAAWVRFIAVVERLPGVLDSQLRRDSGLTHYEYFVMAALSEAPEHTLRMTALAARTNATLPRLSHVVSRMEQRGLLQRSPCRTDRRAFDVRLTEAGWDAIVAAAPGHVDTVRRHVLDALTREQVGQLAATMTAILGRLDPQEAAGVERRTREGAEARAAARGRAGPDPGVPGASEGGGEGGGTTDGTADGTAGGARPA